MRGFSLYCTTAEQQAALRAVGIEASIGTSGDIDSVVYFVPLVYLKRGHPVRSAYVVDGGRHGGQWIIGTHNGLPILAGNSVSRWIDDELEFAGIVRRPYKRLNHIQPLPLPG